MPVYNYFDFLAIWINPWVFSIGYIFFVLCVYISKEKTPNYTKDENGDYYIDNNTIGRRFGNSERNVDYFIPKDDMIVYPDGSVESKKNIMKESGYYEMDYYDRKMDKRCVERNGDYYKLMHAVPKDAANVIVKLDDVKLLADGSVGTKDGKIIRLNKKEQPVNFVLSLFHCLWLYLILVPIFLFLFYIFCLFMNVFSSIFYFRNDFW
tara:strand:+ start:691 stop:1314 length:624 start_codon:yes stop_codon:yes gene_type:complete